MEDSTPPKNHEDGIDVDGVDGVDADVESSSPAKMWVKQHKTELRMYLLLFFLSFIN